MNRRLTEFEWARERYNKKEAALGCERTIQMLADRKASRAARKKAKAKRKLVNTSRRRNRAG